MDGTGVNKVPGLWHRRAARRLRARRVRRLVRHVEPWSVLKVSLIMYTCAWAILLFVGVTLWELAVGSGLVANVENFVTELGALESFKIHGDQIFRIASVGGLVLVVALTGLTVLGSVLFNLISDITGGVRVTVVEEETARPRARRSHRRVLVAAPPPTEGPTPAEQTPLAGRPPPPVGRSSSRPGAPAGQSPPRRIGGAGERR